MSQLSTYTCHTCGEIHHDWPALAFSSPLHYDNLNDQDKETIATLSSDFCTIEDGETVDRFIRCTLSQLVNDHCEDLQYGLWVSLSEKSFKDYKDNFNNENHEVTYFGWLCNNVPGYQSTLSIPTTVYTQTDNNRPLIVPHEDFDHPFVKDYYGGITKHEAEKRINEMIGLIND
ncbi:DUF2199 domain-containing protein [Pedobacter jeongneungensis]|uniref:DUF2199 domain-containing protein n=1 Tax=Pedobacter jeongneungensis TaxID=947309 RepID=UPI00046A6B88|nr:DUF2199 domain-containing protein [Pedobacter jeongneungensis]